MTDTDAPTDAPKVAQEEIVHINGHVVTVRHIGYPSPALIVQALEQLAAKHSKDQAA